MPFSFIFLLTYNISSPLLLLSSFHPFSSSISSSPLLTLTYPAFLSSCLPIYPSPFSYFPLHFLPILPRNISHFSPWFLSACTRHIPPICIPFLKHSGSFFTLRLLYVYSTSGLKWLHPLAALSFAPILPPFYTPHHIPPGHAFFLPQHLPLLQLLSQLSNFPFSLFLLCIFPPPTPLATLPFSSSPCTFPPTVQPLSQPYSSLSSFPAPSSPPFQPLFTTFLFSLFLVSTFPPPTPLATFHFSLFLPFPPPIPFFPPPYRFQFTPFC